MSSRNTESQSYSSIGPVTMRFTLVALTALVAVATVNCHYLPSFGEGPLYEDIQYFTDMIPLDEVMTLTLQYASEDAEFQELLMYFESNDFKELLTEIEKIPEFRNFAAYLQKNGVNINNVLNKVNKLAGIPAFQPTLLADQKIIGGIKGYFDQVKALVDYDLFIHGYVYKMRHSPAFRDFVRELKAPNHQKFINTLYSNERYLKFRNMISVKGIDVALIEDIIYTVLGIEFPELKNSFVVFSKDTGLAKDIHDFEALIDREKILSIVLKYLDDDQVQVAINDMYSEEFHELVRQVEALKAYQDLVLYLNDAGLDIFSFLQKVHKIFGMEDYVPPKRGFAYRTYANRGGVKAMLDEIIAILPMDQFKTMFDEKMNSSPEFKSFIEKLRSPDFQTIVNAVYSAPIFLEMRQKALDDGLDLAPVKQIFKDITGVDLPIVP